MMEPSRRNTVTSDNKRQAMEFALRTQATEPAHFRRESLDSSRLGPKFYPLGRKEPGLDSFLTCWEAP